MAVIVFLQAVSMRSVAGGCDAFLDLSAVRAIVQAVAAAMGVDAVYVAFVGCTTLPAPTINNLRSRRLAGSTGAVIVTTETSVPVDQVSGYDASAGNEQAAATAAYESLGAELLGAVESGSLQKILNETSQALGATTLEGALVGAAEVGALQIVYPPSLSPSAAPSAIGAAAAATSSASSGGDILYIIIGVLAGAFLSAAAAAGAWYYLKTGKVQRSSSKKVYAEGGEAERGEGGGGEGGGGEGEGGGGEGGGYAVETRYSGSSEVLVYEGGDAADEPPKVDAYAPPPPALPSPLPAKAAEAGSTLADAFVAAGK